MSSFDFNIWQKSFDKSFLFVNERSNVRPDWLNYNEVLKTEYKNSIIKPINKYIYKLCPPPKLVSISNNVVTLCQENFAEIFLLKKTNSLSLIATEKIHVRQFYLSKEEKEKKIGCFDQVFNWAMPWFIDEENIDIEILPVLESPFYFYSFFYKSKKTLQEKIEPLLLFFKFKDTGSHMLDEECGRIKRQQPAYLIKFACDDIMVNKIKEFYGKDKILSI
jgi:hypothetical protein